MASLMSSATASMAQASMVAPIASLKTASTFPVTRKAKSTNSRSSGLKVNCMQVWPPLGLKKFETLSYLPPLSEASLLKEIEYLIRKGWIPCIEFSVDTGFVYRENHRSPGYYDGRYWTMWKLPMYGCTDATQVAKEVEEAKTAYPQAFIRIIGFDNKRQVQCISFICYKPEGF